ncbi:hypothetical protein HDU79_006020 [Rhizoclosmatium sp. JEL0117]|nr:hypothetical protein HDU79_006020 [Rhizoclosmatium sp. JEL0117]
MILRNRATLLTQRIDFIYTTLLTFCFFWSSAYTAKYIAFPVWNQVEKNPDSMNQFLAALSTIPVSLMISTNVLLAMERYCIIRELPWSKCKYYFFASISFSTTLIIIYLSIFTTSTCSNGVFPDTKPQMYIWILTNSIGFITGFGAIIYCYTATYKFIKRRISETLADHHVDQVRVLLQRKVLRNSILMTIGVLICYIPESIAMGFMSAKVLRRDTVVGAVLIAISYASMLADTIVTPCLILYFSAPLRDAFCFWKQREKDEDEWGVRYDDDLLRH